MHQSNESDLFKAAVINEFKMKKIKFEIDRKLNGKIAEHRVDLFYPNSKNYVINLIHGSNLTQKVYRNGFIHHDVMEVSPYYSWVSIINSQDNWSKVNLKILGGFSKIFDWGQKSELFDKVLQN